MLKEPVVVERAFLYKKFDMAYTEEELKKEPNRVNWEGLSQNPNAIPLLEANPDKIYWNW